ncbi:MAG: pyroglutamyl-peptidase I [Eubacteriales bacterium]
MNKVLLTGFSPFGGESVNPSFEAVKGLPDRIGDFELVKVELPVAYQRMDTMVQELIALHRPDGIISVGQAAGRKAITPELIAINLMHGRSADNDGVICRNRPVIPDDPAAYFSTLPVFDMVDALTKAGYPAELSTTAGTYVCNTLMYCLLYRTKGSQVPAGFIHVPCLPSQTVGRCHLPSMELERITCALEICIKILLQNPNISTPFLPKSTLQN